MVKRNLARFFRISIPEVDFLPITDVTAAGLIMEVEAKIGIDSTGDSNFNEYFGDE